MKSRIGKTVGELQVGDRAYFAKTLTESDMMLFAGITGDLNPLPIDEEFARRTRFGGRIAHGMLTASFISTILGMKLPGFGSVLHRLKVRFVAPVRLGTTIEVCVELTEVRPEDNRIAFQATVIDQNGRTVLQGSGEASPPLALDD